MQNPIKEKLRAGQPSIGSWRNLASPMAAEVMAAAGFEDVHFLWDTEEDEDDSNYERVERGDPDEAWITYIVGQKR